MVVSDDALEAWASVCESVLLGLPEGVCLIERTSALPGDRADYRYLWANGAAADHSGVAGAVGRTLREVVPEDEADEWCAVYDEVWLRHGRLRFTKALTSRGRVQELTAFTAGPPGRPVLAVVFRDVTDEVLSRALRSTREREVNEIASALQHAILSPTTALPDGVAARYRPAVDSAPGGHPLLVCGDFHDVVGLPGERCALVVGDVTGKGLRAATVMGQLRSAARALVLEDRGPAHVLAALDRFAELVDGAHMTTIVCAVVHTPTGELVHASAGHLPVVVAGAGEGYRLLDGPQGPPLACVPGVARGEGTARLRPGETLLLYTDGLVERRDHPIDDGIAQVGRGLAALAGLAPEEVADRLLELIPPALPADDTALVVYRHR
ncbi:PP2C family protein-serine/threonine phosphatase [Actinokineospora bangkokensis]|uniref:PPM-type phosphatase domain-containing protein n=1 Tax=Actinokineospora bangkokensis TaxID=1193682 RepID=A0A1Q9LJZ1_9PSEU|nr:SpoIIE family protein phosphatase [Actinokineospora bangkokensis]OLR92348.1 hypothetical protein BJP25_19835 [Actinokineospora bangkokensis]